MSEYRTEAGEDGANVPIYALDLRVSSPAGDSTLPGPHGQSKFGT